MQRKASIMSIRTFQTPLHLRTLISPSRGCFTKSSNYLFFSLLWGYIPGRVRRRSAVFASASQPNPVPNPKTYLNNPPDEYLSLAQDSVADFLHEELGVSLDDSKSIASNSPKYAQMIVEGVRDLEEWNTMNGNALEGFNGVLGFKDKVVYMVKQKGDGGKVAFLESFGFSISSAMGLARYLSSEPLPLLIQRVKYVKEIFFSGSDDKGLAGNHARRMMMHLSITIDEDVQQTLSFFEKIEARRGGLSMLGSVDASFRFLVESFPRLLLLSVENDVKPMVEFLESTGIPKGCLGKVLLLFPPIMLCDAEEIKRRASALGEIGGPSNVVGKMLLKYPWVLSTGIQGNYKQLVSLFDGEQVPRVFVNRAIRRWPPVLGCSKSYLKLIVEEFDELGVRNKKLGKIISTSPQLLLRKPKELLQTVSFLEDIGFDKETVGKILCRCPEIFATSIEKTLKRKLKFLSCCGISNDHLPPVIKKYPEVLVSDVDQTLLPRIKYLKAIGLSERDIASMLRRFSPLLGYSIDEVLRPKLDFLVNNMEKPVTEVVDYPRYFSYSLEKKIKPRYWVLKGRNIECSLKDMLGKNDEEFAAEFMGFG